MEERSTWWRLVFAGALYELLANPIYVGEIRHKSERYPGQHQAIVSRELWEKVQKMLRVRSSTRGHHSTVSRSGFLAGKLFDETGEPLYSCTTMKGGRQYRYYVSRKLIRSGANNGTDGWRLAAKEIERSVLTAMDRTLRDRGTTSALLHNARASAAEIDGIIKEADRQSKKLGESPSSTIAASLLKQVGLAKDGLNLSLDLTPLTPDKVKLVPGASLQIRQFIPLKMKRRGVEIRLVLVGGNDSGRSVDPVLLRAISRGYRWFSELASGTATNTLEIAKREQVADSYVRRLIPLALLSPTVIEAICSGRQPADWSSEVFTRRMRLPVDWREKERQFALAM